MKIWFLVIVFGLHPDAGEGEQHVAVMMKDRDTCFEVRDAAFVHAVDIRPPAPDAPYDPTHPFDPFQDVRTELTFEEIRCEVREFD